MPGMPTGCTRCAPFAFIGSWSPPSENSWCEFTFRPSENWLSIGASIRPIGV